MTEENARKVANAVLAVAAVGAAYYVLRTPALRRLAVRLAAAGLTSALPRWIGREVTEAWVESGRSGRRAMMAR